MENQVIINHLSMLLRTDIALAKKNIEERVNSMMYKKEKEQFINSRGITDLLIGINHKLIELANGLYIAVENEL